MPQGVPHTFGTAGSSATPGPLVRAVPGVAGRTCDRDNDVTDMTGRCKCFLFLHVPTGVEAWWPTRDDEPGPAVQVVVRYGDRPEFRRVVRVASGWQEDGASVRCGRPAVMPWCDVGNCWAGKSHPVVVPGDESTGE